MPKRLPKDDFRAVRMVLRPSDFAFGNSREPKPTDMVDRKTWRSITVLPDDVAVRTSNHHGSFLSLMNDLWAGWIDRTGRVHDPLSYGIMDTTDELQASTYNAMCGYYRQAAGCLRNVIEQMTICAYFQLTQKRKEFENWQSGNRKASFDTACAGLNGTEPVRSLTAHLAQVTNDDLFSTQSKKEKRKAGFARRFHSELSDYSHSRPGFATFDMWQSNGPVYVQESFIKVSAMYFMANLLGFILVKLSRETFSIPEAGQRLLKMEEVNAPEVIRNAMHLLFT